MGEGIGIVTDAVTIAVHRLGGIVGEGIGIVAGAVTIAVHGLGRIVGEGVGTVAGAVAVAVNRRREGTRLSSGDGGAVGAVDWRLHVWRIRAASRPAASASGEHQHGRNRRGGGDFEQGGDFHLGVPTVSNRSVGKPMSSVHLQAVPERRNRAAGTPRQPSAIPRPPGRRTTRSTLATSRIPPVVRADPGRRMPHTAGWRHPPIV